MKNQIERIETLRILSGGVIRTIVILFGILIKDKNQDELQDLENVLDEVTTLYQAKLNKLSIDQNIMVALLALTWDAISLDDISFKGRIHIEKARKIILELEKLNINTKSSHKNFYKLLST